MITLPEEQAGEFAALLRAQGARVIHFPTIKIVPVDNWRDLDRAIGAIGDYRWIIFTSANSVSNFSRRLRELRKDIRDLKGIRIGTIGPAAGSAVEDRGIRVDLAPESLISGGVIEALRKENVKECRILLLHSEAARDVIPGELTKLGAAVEVVTVDRTVSSGRKKSELEECIKKETVDVMTFTSSSTVANFMEIMGRDYSLPSQVKIACIGPVTAATVRKAGLKIDILPQNYTITGLVEEMVDYFSKE